MKEIVIRLDDVSGDLRTAFAGIYEQVIAGQIEGNGWHLRETVQEEQANHPGYYDEMDRIQLIRELDKKLHLNKTTRSFARRDQIGDSRRSKHGLEEHCMIGTISLQMILDAFDEIEAQNKK